MSADNQVSQFQKRIKELESQNQILQEKVDYLTHKLFGRSSEISVFYWSWKQNWDAISPFSSFPQQSGRSFIP